MRFFHPWPSTAVPTSPTIGWGWLKVRHLPILFALNSLASLHCAAAEATIPASTTSHDRSTPLYFSLPAPRGQILDAKGASLARNTSVRRLILQVPPLTDETPESFRDWVKTQWQEVLHHYPDAILPPDEFLIDHFKSRRLLPFAISSAKSPNMGDSASEESIPLNYISWRVEYQRDYPHADSAAHVLGYVAPVGPVASGPLHHGEPLWREVQGKEGLEAALDKELTGKPGLLMMSFDSKTFRWEEKVVQPPQAGNDVVTTLRLPTQQSAEQALAESKRSGALVVVDASNGDILAMASAPTFNPSIFATGMNQDEFAQFTGQASQPLNHRAITSLYPPGSVFKPFVALGILNAGAIQSDTRFLCGPDLEIDGRKFGNWSDSDYGMFDMRAALIRSCNTYFYQAAISSGAKPIIKAARDFGFGSHPTFPLTNLAAGTLPSKVSNRQSLANLSIGQGDVLVCPLQVAVAMAALANDGGRPQPRLVSQVQNQKQDVVSVTTVKAMGVIDSSAEHLESVRHGMYGVVNHQNGTATKARQKNIPIYGKTGTAQWSNQGKKANVVWFGGFIRDSTPPIAFVVALEGKPGETISGGQTAAPVIAKVLSDIASSPNIHGIKFKKTEVPFEEDPLIGDPAMVPVFAGQAALPAAPPTSLDARPGDSLMEAAPPAMPTASAAPTPVLRLSKKEATSSPSSSSEPSQNVATTNTLVVAPGQKPQAGTPEPPTRSISMLPAEVEADRPPPPPPAKESRQPAKKRGTDAVVIVPKAEAVEASPVVVDTPAAVAAKPTTRQSQPQPPPSSSPGPPSAPADIAAPKALPVVESATSEPLIIEEQLPSAQPPQKTKRKGFLFFGGGDDEDESTEAD